jgi:hypothetical protein
LFFLIHSVVNRFQSWVNYSHEMGSILKNSLIFYLVRRASQQRFNIYFCRKRNNWLTLVLFIACLSCKSYRISRTWILLLWYVIYVLNIYSIFKKVVRSFLNKCLLVSSIVKPTYCPSECFVVILTHIS